MEEVTTSRFVASTLGDRSFDHYARLARRLLGVPVALVSLVEADRQVFPGLQGLEGPYAEARETPLSHSFCQYVVADERPLVIADARQDPRLQANLAIPDLGVVAYAGMPLEDPEGRVVGSLCAIDSSPREWTADDLAVLEDLATACTAELQGAWRQAEDDESLLRTIVDTVDVGIAFFDDARQLVTANALAERLADADAELLPRVLRGDLAAQEMEWVGPHGRQVAVLASAQRVHRADGSPRGTLVALHDITQLVRALGVKNDFISTVSHELRTPLTSIMGYLELLRDELEPAEGIVAGALGTINRNALRLRERVQQLLDTADRRRFLDLAPTDLVALVGHAVASVEATAQEVGVRMAVEADGPQWATVDALQVEQALENLLTNAIKYNHDGGSVTVAVSGSDEQVRLEVRDTGVGMTPDEISQAAETFWRADSARDAAIQGFGIGLGLVRDITEAHRGELSITSEPDAGTTVVLCLPTAPELMPLDESGPFSAVSQRSGD